MTLVSSYHTFFLAFSTVLWVTSALSTSSNVETYLRLSKARLHESLKSLSGKLTLSPEIQIPDSEDPTTILLQSTAISQLSFVIRKKAKANAAFLSGSLTAVQIFCNEQEKARGEFPGPVPIIYCGDSEDAWSALAESGVCGVLIPCNLNELDVLKSKCAEILKNGLHPLPDITLLDSEASHWMKQSFMEDLVSDLTEVMGQEPASLFITIQSSSEESDEVQPPFPIVSKDLRKRLPILSSISVSAGGGRMGLETKRVKEAGFTGAVLRSGCVPPVFVDDLTLVSRFWASCIGELKSTRSKSFEFRTRNYMDSNAALDWAKYQKSVIESGALGFEEHSSINSDAGDYQGF